MPVDFKPACDFLRKSYPLLRAFLCLGRWKEIKVVGVQGNAVLGTAVGEEGLRWTDGRQMVPEPQQSPSASPRPHISGLSYTVGVGLAEAQEAPHALASDT